ncbi:hypothetical protein XELAEV_18004366mg [Xenopus laevis]|uniref:Solute carrier organic anion transporter family member n=1 Tax=Xenopus laevis TaxID=8355 RepID=A0A974BRU1_XENLA|nr:hypothetical protein XELAEV_18004366mg [Xenopus laevis]
MVWTGSEWAGGTPGRKCGRSMVLIGPLLAQIRFDLPCLHFISIQGPSETPEEPKLSLMDEVKNKTEEKEKLTLSQFNYTGCSCIPAGSTAKPGSCGTGCFHLFKVFMALLCLAGGLASMAQTPSFMLIIRSVKPTDKSLAIGIQLMLLRILAWLPGPVMYGSVIDSTCILWGRKCGKKTSCLYYDNNHLRQRYIGLQILFEIMALIFFIALFFVLRRRENKTVDQSAAGNPETHALTQEGANA